MKKIICMILVILLMVSSSAATVFAKPAWKGGNSKFVPPGLSNKFFDDDDEVEWAQQAIEKLKAKGLVRGTDGKFQPNKPVTKIEAVAMALRIMDLEDRVRTVYSLPQKYRGDEVQKWAVGYVTIAAELGILDEVDLMYFKPHEPAKRHEVAKYVVRALGGKYESMAREHMKDELSFVDASAIPQGSVGYVYVVSRELKIMNGDGKNFNPMGTFTRAEMAVLFNNLDDKVDNDRDYYEYTGRVVSAEDDLITIKVNDTNKTFRVSDNVVVYEGRKRIHYFSINIGDKVQLVIENDRVVYIQVMETDDSWEDDTTTYTGKLKEIRTQSPASITLETSSMTAIFYVATNEVIFRNGVKGVLADLRAGTNGDTVTITVDRQDRVIRISTNRDKLTRETVSGVFEEMYNQNQNMRIKVGGVLREYPLARIVDINIKDYDDTFSNLRKGMKVELEIVDGRIEYIYAEDDKFTIHAEIRRISVSDGRYTLKVRVSNTDYYYEVSTNPALTIVRHDRPLLRDLEVGMKGTFEVTNNILTKINITEMP